ncbi:hypothetical protein KFE98_00025 [bacterium SCSIO 12741]|nr:hypothetical protein KFE98_00025 [bacterium SCSIO 12741]
MSQVFENFLPYADLMQHKKYMNNYLYHRTLYLMNKEQLLDNEFVLLKEDSGLHSPLGVLFYEYYTDLKEVKVNWTQLQGEIQCTIGQGEIPFGKAQHPALNEYADHVDTLDFLLNIG